MEEISEFRAFTQLSYLTFEEMVKGGLKRIATLGPSGRSYDQDAIVKKLESYESGFLPQLSFQHAVTVFESWLFDILRHLLANRNRLNKKRKIEISEIIACNTMEELIAGVIEAELNEIKYKKPTEWFDYLRAFVGITAPTQNQIDSISEIKASRDILVHNDGFVNPIYLSKAGSFARGIDGGKLSFDHQYVFDSWQCLNTVIKETGQQIASKLDT